MNTSPSLDTCVVLLGSLDRAYRDRATVYYAQTGLDTRVIDEVEGMRMRQALLQVLDQIDCAFVVLTNDCDFLMPEAVQQAHAWLCSHPQAAGVQGYALGMRPGNATVSYLRLGESAHEQADDDVRERVFAHARSGLQPWRALLRVETLRAALVEAEMQEDWRVGLSLALLCQFELPVLEHTLVVSECRDEAPDADALAPTLRALRQWDEQQARHFEGDEGFAVLRQFVLATATAGERPLLFESPWSSVEHAPVRQFEMRQFVELPYYNAQVFRQLSVLEFLVHAWPAGHQHVHAVEGAWVRQRDLLVRQANDSTQSLLARYWEALTVNLFSPQVCRLLLQVLGKDQVDVRAELGRWLDRLEQVQAPDVSAQLAATPSGRVLEKLAGATLTSAAKQRVQKRVAMGKGSRIGLFVLDLHDDDAGLQRTFDSIVLSGLRDVRIMVLKVGKLPAITTVRDTLHFVKVTGDNLVSHLNHLIGQLPCEWLMLLQAGDELAGSGLLRLQLELAEAQGVKAVCGNEVQRDEDGRLVAVLRPGADIDLLRSRPDLMASHWLLQRDTVMQVGGYSETCRGALDLDLLLRLIEAQGMAGLAHIEEFLVIGPNQREAMLDDAVATEGRHLSQLGYAGKVEIGYEGRLFLDFRHPSTPMVSIILEAGDDMQRLATSLASIQQRTRYPRYEVLVVTRGDEGQEASLGGRARMLSCSAEQQSDRLGQAVGQARGEYLIFMSDRCQVSSPGWIESLLNQAQRPEVGVVGCQMHDENGRVSHAGYELLDDRQVHATWLGLPVDERGRALGLDVVRGCPAVSGDGLMVGKQVLEALGGLSQDEAWAIGLCLQASQAGLLVLMAPQAQLVNSEVPMLSEQALEVLVEQAPWAFSRGLAMDGASGLTQPVDSRGPHWLRALD